MKITSLEGAAQGNPALRSALTEVQDYLTSLSQLLGVDPRSQTTNNSKVKPPSQASFTATGVGGLFVISIENSIDPTNTQPIYHQVRTATDIPIEHADQYDDTSVTPNTHIVVPDPNATKFIGIRSKYINSRFNNWRVLPQSIFSGSVGAASLPTADLPRSINPGARPLMVQQGTTNIVQIFPFDVQFPGSALVHYDGGYVSDLTFGITYYVYVDDARREGGTRTFIATPSLSTLLDDEGRVLVGAIRLGATGGSMSLPIGVHGGVADDTIVTLADGSLRNIHDLGPGTQIKGIDPSTVETITSTTPLSGVLCFTITTSTGKVITVSSDSSLQLGVGSRFQVLDMVPGDSIDTQDGQEQITSKVLAGPQTVYAVELSSYRYLLGNGIWVA